MKIAILTHPLRVNYGGLLQAYALKKVLERQGHKVFHIQLESYKYKVSPIIISYIKACIKYIIYSLQGKPRPFYTLLLLPKYKMDLIRSETTAFQKELNIKYYHKFDTNLNREYDAFIVGSDQIWRPGFTPNIHNYYLDFADDSHLKIAYAASLGVDYWPYSTNETLIIEKLIKRFSLVTVREYTAEDLFYNHFSIRPRVVVDPTLLLSAKEYKSLITTCPPSLNAEITIYLLNEEKEKEAINILKRSNTTFINLMPLKRIKYRKERYTNDAKYISPKDWLYRISNAKYIITDSFHGTIFSIIFNKQFIVIPNTLGGNSRICSLLQTLNLEDRFILSPSIRSIKQMLNKPINYTPINIKIEELKKESLNLLINLF